MGIYSGASAITSVAGLMIHPYGALLIGFIAPILAVITFLYLLVSEERKYIWVKEKRKLVDHDDEDDDDERVEPNLSWSWSYSC